jgi:hypothetical protein
MSEASQIAVWSPIIVGPLLVLIGVYFVHENKGNNFINSFVLGIGLSLLLFDVVAKSGPIKEVIFKAAAVAVSVKTGAPEAEAIMVGNAANIQPFIDKTNKAIDEANIALQIQDRKINTIVSALNSRASSEEKNKIDPVSIQQIKPISPNYDDKTALVFYRTNDKLANSIVNLLRKNGFKSAAAQSSLGEVKKWVKNAGQNAITIAASGDNQQLSDSIKTILLSDTESSIQASQVTADSGWSFGASDAQIYIF